MKKPFYQLFIALPLFTLFVFTSCSDDKSGSGEEGTKTEEEKPKEPLMDRDPQVKEYFKVLNEMINEYITVGETTLDIAEKLDQGKLGLMDAAKASSQLLEAMEAIQELEESLAQQGTIKENIERNLNAEDILEFTQMYSESLSRVDSITKRLEEVDVSKYLEDYNPF